MHRTVRTGDLTAMRARPITVQGRRLYLPYLQLLGDQIGALITVDVDILNLLSLSVTDSSLSIIHCNNTIV